MAGPALTAPPVLRYVDPDPVRAAEDARFAAAMQNAPNFGTKVGLAGGLGLSTAYHAIADAPLAVGGWLAHQANNIIKGGRQYFDPTYNPSAPAAPVTPVGKAAATVQKADASKGNDVKMPPAPKPLSAEQVSRMLAGGKYGIAAPALAQLFSTIPKPYYSGHPAQDQAVQTVSQIYDPMIQHLLDSPATDLRNQQLMEIQRKKLDDLRSLTSSSFIPTIDPNAGFVPTN